MAKHKRYTLSSRNQRRHGKRDYRQDPQHQGKLGVAEYVGQPARYYTLERPDSKFVGIYVYAYDKNNHTHMEDLAKFLKLVVSEYKEIGYDSMSTTEWIHGNPYDIPFTDKAGYNSDKNGCSEFYKLNVEHKELSMPNKM